mmetsp:Transcript_42726/g.76664  ORF Transcript_42726/g.76664 Transcript_42726/m.76664 type:complete len:205 (-) Transcript_42726:573-1187(-)
MRIGQQKTTGATRHGPCYPTSPRNYSRAAQQPRWSPPGGKGKRGIRPLPNWRATRRSFRPDLTCSVPGGGTDAVQSASLIGPSLYSGFPPGLVVPPPGRCQCYTDPFSRKRVFQGPRRRTSRTRRIGRQGPAGSRCVPSFPPAQPHTPVPPSPDSCLIATPGQGPPHTADRHLDSGSSRTHSAVPSVSSYGAPGHIFLSRWSGS